MENDNCVLAIIDSGIDKIHDNIIEVLNYTEEESVDLCGHGTCVYNYLMKHGIESSIIISKIMNCNGKSNGKLLLRALEDLLDRNVNIICMPISFHKINNINSMQEIQLILKKLKEKNVIMLCSYENGMNVSFPAINENIIGVWGGYLNYDLIFWYANRNMVTNIFPECVRTLYNKRTFFSGNSKACALASVIVEKYIYKYRDFASVEKKLTLDSGKAEWEFQDINTEISWMLQSEQMANQCDDTIIIDPTIIKCLEKYVNEDFFNSYDIVWNENNIGLVKNMDNLLNELCDELCMDIDDDDILPYDFINIFYLNRAIERWKNTYEDKKSLSK